MNIDKKNLKHIAIIMDGNGRWAKQRGFRRTVGHENGVKVVQEITKYCNNIGIKYLTLYAFSTENWDRPKLEVDFLMNLLGKYLKDKIHTYLENDIRFKAIGDLSKFPKTLQKTIDKTQKVTKNAKGLVQTLALNYGSQDEILRAIKKLNKKNLGISKENFEKCLDTFDLPDVDLLIRTSGEVRLSNYLLWQNAYSEMFFINKYWPEFTVDDLDKIINDYNKRERRFGGI